MIELADAFKYSFMIVQAAAASTDKEGKLDKYLEDSFGSSLAPIIKNTLITDTRRIEAGFEKVLNGIKSVERKIDQLIKEKEREERIRSLHEVHERVVALNVILGESCDFFKQYNNTESDLVSGLESSKGEIDGENIVSPDQSFEKLMEDEKLKPFDRLIQLEEYWFNQLEQNEKVMNIVKLVLDKNHGAVNLANKLITELEEDELGNWKKPLDIYAESLKAEASLDMHVYNDGFLDLNTAVEYSIVSAFLVRECALKCAYYMGLNFVLDEVLFGSTGLIRVFIPLRESLTQEKALKLNTKLWNIKLNVFYEYQKFI